MDKARIIIFSILLIGLGAIFLMGNELSDVNNQLNAVELQKDFKVNQLENKVKEEESKVDILFDSLRTKAKQKEVNYMYGIATAYHPPSGGINADSNPEVTSTGRRAEVGIIAVNPKIIPYGSQILILDGKTVIRGIAADTGSAMRKNPKQVDILMETREEAINWGKRESHVLWW